MEKDNERFSCISFTNYYAVQNNLFFKCSRSIDWNREKARKRMEKINSGIIIGAFKIDEIFNELFDILHHYNYI